MLDAATFSLLTAPRRLVLRVPRLDAARSITIHDDSIDGSGALDGGAASGAQRAATSRSDEATSSGDDDFADGELDEPVDRSHHTSPDTPCRSNYWRQAVDASLMSVAVLAIV